jgi:hypothetical protein
MEIGHTIDISDEKAQKFGFHHGGVVTYQSEKLDPRRLLRLDPEYNNGIVYTDEVNMEFAEARRSMSNTNLLVDTVAQQIRKYENWWIYTVINEMFVDSRLRDLTDIFIRCQDTALTIDGLEKRKPVGIDFKWTIYPMSGYLHGEEGKYSVTHKADPPVLFHFEPLRGIYNNRQAQAVGKIKYGINMNDDTNSKVLGTMQTAQSQDLKRNIKDLSWLETIANKMCADGRRFIPAEEIYNHEEVLQRQLSKNEITILLQNHFNLYTQRRTIKNRTITVFEMPEEILIQ